jgi:ATP synthase regulation protein NCA2
MVNALYTMDDMMTKNEINTNLAAVTPAVLLLYAARNLFRFFYYALLKLGKSKEETYSTFRQILTDIERLLVMRDNPPTSPFPNHQLQIRHTAGDTEEASQSQLMPPEPSHKSGCDVLSADDLGMLMLHIHECRTILWTDYNRFSPAAIQSVSEDLAELAGERGRNIMSNGTEVARCHCLALLRCSLLSPR